MKKVAVFDIDGTLFRSSLLIELVEALVEEGSFSPSVREVYQKEKVKWLDRKGDYEKYISTVVKAFEGHLKGVHYNDFECASKRVVLRQKDRVYRYTRDLIMELKKKNYYILAISQSPKAILDPFCKRLGFDKVYGRIYEIGPTDRFTGNVVEEHLISNKANIVSRAVKKELLTLKGSIGIGDTEGDITFLEMMEKSICFNPNMKLYKHAKKRKWDIVVERKDVIYKM